MRRRGRRLIGVLAPLTLVMALVSTASSQAAHSAPSLTKRAYDAGLAAYVHGYPPLVSSASQRRFLVNGLVGVASATTPANRLVVLPNVDTAYSVARLDLRSGPVVVQVPAMARRYYVLQMMDAYTNVFGYIGTRTTGSRAGEYAIVGPGYRGSVPGMRTLHSPTPDAMVLGRILIEPGDTTIRLQAILASFAMTPLSALDAGGQPHHSLVIDTAPRSRPPTLPAGMAFLDAFDRTLTSDPPSGAERRALAPLARFGIGPGRMASSTNLSPSVRRALLRGVAAGPAHLSALVTQTQEVSVRAHAGWVLPDSRTGAYGSDWVLRAVIAKTQLWAKTPAESVSPIAGHDSAGRRLSGRHRYTLTFKRRPPAKAFWSVTMYDSGLHLYANSLNRYALGDRSPGLVPGRGGTLTLYIQHEQQNGHTSSWLPAPEGAFTVALRMYVPSAAVIKGRWTPPGIRCLDCSGGHR